ncbi:S1 family peptidase [Streptomyces purpureus]|uniref:Protease n=1 Tax=Streptomyces purpureus TaxID=1951 RepID=A0A918GWB1_9ACTN|nr:S1 family peptidase [Streptomyces purpureus]GGT14431.1 protease [Streptomyces purpureus]
MRHARRSLRRLMRFAAAGGVVCGSLMVTHAVANEPPGAAPGQVTYAAGPVGGGPAPAVTEVVRRLGDARTAGSWAGADGRPVVAVTDAGAAAEARRAGATVKRVRHSMDTLRAATESLGAEPRVPGTAWAVDYAANQVVVRADTTVSADDWSRLSGVAERTGGVVRMERTTGAFTTRVNAAAPIFASGGRCSAGFNVTDGRDVYVLTAGHCGPAGTAWFQNSDGSRLLGTTVTADFPGSDFALVRYERGAPLGGADVVAIGGGRGVRITGAADPVVGQRVFRSGSTTGLRDGRVTALNATVNYPEGTVTGLTETTVCAERGDSGGPLFAQGLALGLTSGGNGDCARGGVTYFQPAVKTMRALGVRPVALPGSQEGGTGEQGGGSPAAPSSNPPASPPAGTPVTTAPSPEAPAVPGAQGAPPGGPAGAAGSGPGTVSGIADGFGPLGGVAPGLAVIAVSVVLFLISRWLRNSQGRRDYRDLYSQTWA